MELLPKNEFLMDFMEGFMAGNQELFEKLEVDEAKATLEKAEGWAAGYYATLSAQKNVVTVAAVSLDLEFIDEHIESLKQRNMSRLAKHLLETTDHEQIRTWLNIQECGYKESMRGLLNKAYVENKAQRAGR